MNCLVMLFAFFSLLVSGYAKRTNSQLKNPHGDIKMECSQCHTPKRWKPTKRNIDFDHGKSGFPLSGSHASLLCTECHKDLKFPTVSSACADCHKDEHDGKFGFDCQTCHTTKKWGKEFLTVEAQVHTEFPLVGAHAIEDCSACHKNQKPEDYVNTPTNCSACHLSDFEATISPDHRALNFSTNCTGCHLSSVVTGWRGGTNGVIHPETLPLTGAHGRISCYDCHNKNSFTGLNPTCYECHQDNFAATSKPNHRELNFPIDCQMCHTNEDWKTTLIPEGTEFKHPESFPLLGGHATPKCADCHINGYTGTNPECISCHEKDFNETKNPNHIEQNFGKNCSECHTTGEWAGALIPPNSNFQHPATFPLEGGHSVASCTDCHIDGKYTDTPSDCLSCHKANYDTASSPNHLDMNFGTNCAECHNTNNWAGVIIPDNSNFQHPASFPLKEGHSEVECQKCHTSGYTNTSPECISCHEEDFKKAENPNHVDQNFSQNCTECHTVAKDWLGATIPPDVKFDHPASFPLIGGHSNVNCSNCHTDGYTNTATECLSCHKTDYDETKNPNHMDLNFSTNCSECHTVDSWQGAEIPPGGQFQHPAEFPLVAGHADVSCMECHANGYTNTSNECNSCHNDDYLAAEPNHSDLRLPTDCALCHTNVTWQGADIPPNIAINHPSSFPLTLPHDKASCVDCHANGYSNTASDCYACHQKDYEQVQNPNHVQSNYSKDCLSCHKRETWDDASIDHERFFPIATGRHSGFQCSECHVVDGNYAAFECIFCHAHNNRAEVDADHRGEAAGYEYNSQACYRCHPRGRE